MARKVRSPDQTPGLFSSMIQDFLIYIEKTKGESPETKRSYKCAFKLLASVRSEIPQPPCIRAYGTFFIQKVQGQNGLNPLFMGEMAVLPLHFCFYGTSSSSLCA